MKKTILIFILMILSIISFSLAVSPYAYEFDQFGNIGYSEGVDTFVLKNYANNNNITICQPFVAYETGKIISFYFDGTLSADGELKYCFSDEPDRPYSSCYGTIYNLTGAWFNKTTGQDTDFDIMEQVIYYLCIQNNDTAVTTSSLYTVRTDYFPSSDVVEFLPVTVSNLTNIGNYMIDSKDTNSLRLQKSRNLDNGSYVDFTVDNNYFRDFQYCTDSEVCYSVTGDNGNPVDDNHKLQNNEYGGQVILFPFEDSVLYEISFMLLWGAGTSGVETFRINVFEYNITDSSMISLYNSSILSYNEIIGNMTFGYDRFDHVLEESITLEKDKYYFISAECYSGCTIGTDFLYMAMYNHGTGDYFSNGFQDEVGYYYNTFLTNTNLSDAWILLEFMDDLWREDIEIEIEDVLTCPFDNCLFYDNYEYVDYHDLSEELYTLNTDSAVIINNTLYLNSSDDDYPRIKHNFLVDDEYNEIESFIVWEHEDYSEVPSHLENQSITYYISALCDSGIDVSLFNIAFRKDEILCGNESLRMGLYSIIDGIPETYGYYCYPMGEQPIVKTVYHDDTQIMDIVAYYDDYLQEGFLPEALFHMDYQTSCDTFTAFEIGRRDYDNIINTEYIGIDLIYYYGIEDEIIDTVDFEYTNETNQSTAYIKTEIGEELHNLAFTLGFKKTSSKILFWFIVMVLMTLFIAGFCAREKIDASAQKLVTGFCLIIGVITGWYTGFLPSILLAFLIFIVSVAGAVVLMRLINQSGN